MEVLLAYNVITWNCIILTPPDLEKFCGGMYQEICSSAVGAFSNLQTFVSQTQGTQEALLPSMFNVCLICDIKC